MCTPLQKSLFSKPSVLTLLSHTSDLHWSQGESVPVLSIRTVSVPWPNPTTMNEPRSEQQVQLHWGFYQPFNNTKWQIWAWTWKKRSAAGFLCEHRELCPVSTEAQLSGFSGVWRLFPNLRVQHILSIWHNGFCSHQRSLWESELPGQSSQQLPVASYPQPCTRLYITTKQKNKKTVFGSSLMYGFN